MRRSCSLAAALAAAGLALAASAAGAAPGGSVRIGALDTSAYPKVSVGVVATSAGAAMPSLTEDGVQVTGLDGVNLGRAKSIVLAVDRSRSMAGQSLADAKAGARAFADAKRAADRIQIVAFGRHAVALTGFSSDLVDADTTLDGLAVDSTPGTALYDAVVAGAQSLAQEALPGRVLIVLTDGHDVSSKATLDDAIAAARAAHASIYPIAIASKDFDPGPLKALAAATNGTYHEAASSAVLRDVYATIAAELSRTWKLSYVTSGRPGDRLKLVASVPAEGSATATLRIPGTGGTNNAQGSSLPAPAFSLFGTLLVALIVGALVLGTVYLLLGATRGSWVKARLAPHVGIARRGPRSTRERLSFLASLFSTTESAFGHWRQWRSVQRLLERADLPLRAVEFFWASVGCGIVLGLFAVVLGLSPILDVILMLAGAGIPYGVVSVKVRRRTRAFEDQLPDVLNTIAGALKAGHSFKQGLQAVVEEAQEPASVEFKRVLTETGLGRPMDDALAEMADRTGSANFAFAITAVTIQRQVGGSLAGLFDMVAETVRQRQQFARKIRGLTAMGRMSAYVLVGLPFFVALAITVMNPGYMSPLYHTHSGHMLIGGMLMMMSLGALMLRKIVSFRG